jgi:hypothetical protein
MEFIGYETLSSGKKYGIWRDYMDIEGASEDVIRKMPNLMNAMSVSEVTALGKNDLRLIYEILTDSQVIANYIRGGKQELSEIGEDVFQTKHYRDGDEIVLEFHTVCYDNELLI